MKKIKLNIIMMLFVGFCGLLCGILPDVQAQTNVADSSSMIQSRTHIYLPDTTYIPFRSDTLMIIENGWSYMGVDGKIVLANLELHGLIYWDILNKHNINFAYYLQEQLEAIFNKERKKVGR